MRYHAFVCVAFCAVTLTEHARVARNATRRPRRRTTRGSESYSDLIKLNTSSEYSEYYNYNQEYVGGEGSVASDPNATSSQIERECAKHGIQVSSHPLYMDLNEKYEEKSPEFKTADVDPYPLAECIQLSEQHREKEYLHEEGVMPSLKPLKRIMKEIKRGVKHNVTLDRVKHCYKMFKKYDAEITSASKRFVYDNKAINSSVAKAVYVAVLREEKLLVDGRMNKTTVLQHAAKIARPRDTMFKKEQRTMAKCVDVIGDQTHLEEAEIAYRFVKQLLNFRRKGENQSKPHNFWVKDPDDPVTEKWWKHLI